MHFVFTNSKCSIYSFNGGKITEWGINMECARWGLKWSPPLVRVMNERERECVCVCVWERERERVCVCLRERERERVCVWERGRECVCVWERERERVIVCYEQKEKLQTNPHLLWNTAAPDSGCASCTNACPKLDYLGDCYHIILFDMHLLFGKVSRCGLWLQGRWRRGRGVCYL